MKIVDAHPPTLDRMASLMRPEHYVGFLLGAAFLSLIQQPEPDAEGVKTFMRERDAFVHRQRDAGEPDGMPVAPVYWTDLYPEPMGDLQELMGICEHGCPHMLNSSVEPHSRWFVILGDDNGEEVTQFFNSSQEATQFIKEADEEAKRRRQSAIDTAKFLYRHGDVDSAERAVEGFSIEFSRTASDPGHVIIEGERIQIGEAYRQIAVEKVKAHLREGKFDQADAICASFDFGYRWDSVNPDVAWVDGEALNLFTFNVRNPNAEALPERQVPCSIPSSANE